ncbi:hypothetical protein [Deinococcus enclensis]|uniref:DUF1795 domain-containing protein n=1 Tax=Deinococcus enclensis TaxID=1049582 RepID=A0ABT9MB99_9DEIO|nr:hypothetical protein [Deinococcus enclensis]MDP9763848.1 hypothetical protein [Deinococcus enclensis]
MSFTEHVVDLAEFNVSGVTPSQQSAFHIVMQRQGDEALIEGRSGIRAEGFNHSIYFSCRGAEQQLRDLADLLKRKDDTLVHLRSANLEIHRSGRPVSFRCKEGDPSLRLLVIGSPGATDSDHEIILKDEWDRKLPASQAVAYFAQRLDDLLKDF